MWLVSQLGNYTIAGWIGIQQYRWVSGYRSQRRAYTQAYTQTDIHRIVSLGGVNKYIYGYKVAVCK